MNYKMIACDLDGTLLGDDSHASEENLNAIKALHEKGILFVPVTGRTLYEIPEEVRNCEYIDYIIYSDGSVQYDKQHNATEKDCINLERAREIFHMLEKYTAMTEIYADGYPVTSKYEINKRAYEFYGIEEYYHSVIDETRIGHDHFAQFLDDDKDVEIFNIFFKYENERQEAWKILEKYDDIALTTSMINNLEIMKSGVNKGTALKKFCYNLGIKTEDVIALGDSKNDIEMFKVAGTAVSAENGDPALKEIATAVGCKNTEHLVDYILKNYIGV